MNKTDLKLYAITDRQWLHKARLSEHVKLAIEGGATMIQIRDKDILSTDSDAGLKDEYNEALEIKRICHEHKVPLIINDNVQFAIDIDADGVHLGQDDMNPAEARKLLGADKIIGVTAKTVEQAYDLNQPAIAVAGGKPGSLLSKASVDRSNVVLETIKCAESGHGIIIRMYESENALTKTNLVVEGNYNKAFVCNLLEEEEAELELKDGVVCVQLKPYEVVTVKLV